MPSRLRGVTVCRLKGSVGCTFCAEVVILAAPATVQFVRCGNFQNLNTGCRLWAEKFRRHFANEIRRRSAGKLGDKWYLDEVVISIGGKKHCCGGPSIRMASFSMYWCRAAVIPRPPNV